MSTILVAVGLIFLFTYLTRPQIMEASAFFGRPSYYVQQSFWLLFLSGIIVLLFSLAASFFSWLKTAQKREESLPNAAYAKKEDIQAWVEGTSLDTEQITVQESTDDRTIFEKEDDRTVLLAENDKTVVQSETDKTELILEQEGEKQDE